MEVSLDLLDDEFVDWLKTAATNPLRFGQQWVNKYGPHPCPDVFYEPDYNAAYTKIMVLINDNTYKR